SLGLQGELVEPLEPLAVPLERSAHVEAAAAALIADSPAVELFVARMQAVQPSLAPRPDAHATIAAICRRLDGLPLAIRLAAARTRLFTPDEILQRLESRLAFLGGGRSELPARQRTLRAAIEWSYELLTTAEQRLLRCIGAFEGGCTVEALAFVAEDQEAAER